MRCHATCRCTALALVLLAAGCRSPSADVAVAEQLAQMSDAIVGMQDQLATLSTTVDSLVAVTATQDTLIKKLALTNGVPTP